MNGFLFDENLPRRLTFVPSLPVTWSTTLGPRTSDTVIWDYARQHSLVIVSKDADFSNLIMMATPPPWVVHLRFGNLRRQAFHMHVARIWPQVERLLPSHKLVCVYLDRVEAFSF